MHMRGVNFGHCWDMSGVRGFFGEGYPYHKYLKPIGLTFEGSTFVSKTTTLLKREGNMPLKSDGITPKEFKPNCIKVDFLKGVALNSVSLSGPGAEALFNDGRWQLRTEPWVISFMSLEKTVEERLREFNEFVKLLKAHLPYFKARIALQQNFSCPNVKGMTHEIEEVVEESLKCFDIAEVYIPTVPQVPKLNIFMPPHGVLRMTAHRSCDGGCGSNTVLWGSDCLIDWKKYFDRTGVSPLKHLGGGGLSGKPLLPLVASWVNQIRSVGVEKPIIAGGGILHPRDVNLMALAGASAVAVGSMSMLRPWRMQRTIDRANQLGQRGAFWPEQN